MRADLLTLIEADCGQGRRSGRYWMFHCPFPGHAHGDRNPSLGVTPDNDRWYCFTCKRAGNSIDWLMQHRGLNYPDAIHSLNMEKSERHRPQQAKPEYYRSPRPTASWEKRGLEMVYQCEEYLWSENGKKALAYLHDRGLTDLKIKQYHLGLTPFLDDHYESPELWGEDGNQKKIWIPRGITIPSLVRGKLWGINIRRPTGEPKYWKVRGSKKSLFGAENLLFADVGLLCEGEIDCIIADQVIGDTVGVATFGSASPSFDIVTWGPYFMKLKIVFIVYDMDETGQKTSDLLAALGSRLKKIELPAGNWKDINSFYLAGGDLWELIKPYINQYPSFDFEKLSLFDILGELGGVITMVNDEN